jgi:hypothetical protein
MKKLISMQSFCIKMNPEEMLNFLPKEKVNTLMKWPFIHGFIAGKCEKKVFLQDVKAFREDLSRYGVNLQDIINLIKLKEIYEKYKNNKNSDVVIEATVRGWKRALKVAPVWAKMVKDLENIRYYMNEKGQIIIKTKEGAYEVKPEQMEIAVLSIGVDGEPWIQKKEGLEKKYKNTGETALVGNEEKYGIMKERFYKFIPKPENAKVWAAQIPHAFKVNTSWGQLLGGRPNDWVLSTYDHEGEKTLKKFGIVIPNAEDVWIIADELFDVKRHRLGTYEFI